ncbi:MAG: hypothetical protein OXC93_12385 [Rhodospirillaceae bacterium]|nr:hypothetical protein [Rhodospirillaceae bacterium]
MIRVAEVSGGKALTEHNIRIIWPGHDLAFKCLPAVLGSHAACRIPRVTPVGWEMIRQTWFEIHEA